MCVWLFVLLVWIWGAVMVLGVCMYYLAVFLLSGDGFPCLCQFQAICRNLDSFVETWFSSRSSAACLFSEIDATHELMK